MVSSDCYGVQTDGFGDRLHGVLSNESRGTRRFVHGGCTFFDAPDRRCPAGSENTHKPLERNTNSVLRTVLVEATALNES
jgi:hypothetical protein